MTCHACGVFRIQRLFCRDYFPSYLSRHPTPAGLFFSFQGPPSEFPASLLAPCQQSHESAASATLTPRQQPIPSSFGPPASVAHHLLHGVAIYHPHSPPSALHVMVHGALLRGRHADVFRPLLCCCSCFRPPGTAPVQVCGSGLPLPSPLNTPSIGMRRGAHGRAYACTGVCMGLASQQAASEAR